MTKTSGKLFIVSAPSGAGKTTLVYNVIKRLQSVNISRVITYTTKQPRPHEVAGIDYHFISETEFKARIEQGFFVEYSTVYGAYYGFPKNIVHELEKGLHYIAIVDIDGARAIKEAITQSVLIWIKPPHTQALEERLIARVQDSYDTIKFRLSVAQSELRFDPMELFHHVIVNDDLEEAVQQLAHIIQHSQH